jgi:hypothetical protein
MKSHKDGSKPLTKSVFVFGSNLRGLHGGGAAKAAFESYGAVWGTSFGRQGDSYAIPTKSGKFETLPVEDIRAHVGIFVMYSQLHKETEFFLTRVGCGLAGLTDEQMAPMFKGIGDNVDIPEEWVKYLT